jgi:hypothetical protein
MFLWWRMEQSSLSLSAVALYGRGYAQGVQGGCSEVSMARSSGGAHGCALLKVRVAGMVVSMG